MCHIALSKIMYYTKGTKCGSTRYTKEKDKSHDRSKEGTENFGRENQCIM